MLVSSGFQIFFRHLPSLQLVLIMNTSIIIVTTFLGNEIYVFLYKCKDTQFLHERILLGTDFWQCIIFCVSIFFYSFSSGLGRIFCLSTRQRPRHLCTLTLKYHIYMKVFFLTNSYVSQTFLSLLLSAHLMGCIVEGGSRTYTYLVE